MDNLILIRDDWEDMGQALLPKSYFWSPDIILHERMEDPKGFLSWSYSHDVSQPMLPQGGSMLVYVRVKNMDISVKDIYVHLYDICDGNFTKPEDWKMLTTEANSEYAYICQVASKDIGVTETPFVLNAQKGDNRILIAIASYSKSDPRSKIGKIKDPADFAYWVRENSCVSIRVQDTVATQFTLASNGKWAFRFHSPAQIRNLIFRITINEAFPCGTQFICQSPFFPEKEFTADNNVKSIEIEGNQTTPDKYGNIEIIYALPGTKIMGEASISVLAGIKDGAEFYPIGRSSVKYLQGIPSFSGNVRSLDLGQEEDCSLFYNTCINPEELLDYPCLQKYLAQTKVMLNSGKAEVPLLAVNEMPEPRNTVFSYAHKEEDTVVYTSLLKLEKIPVDAVVKIEVRDKVTGKQIGLNVNTNDASQNMKIQTCVPQRIAPEEVDVLTTLICVNGIADNTTIPPIQAVMIQKTLVGTNNIKNYKIDAPTKKHQANEYICVSVENKITCNSGDSDYKYNIAEHYIKNPEMNREEVPFFLPLKGWIEFDTSRILSPKTPKVSISAKSKQTSGEINVSYRNMDRNKMKWTFEEQKASWEFLDDWDDYIPKINISCSNILELDINFGFYLGRSGETTDVRICSDIQPGQEGNHIKIEYINWSWGCLSRNTRIRMADGSEKPIEDIHPGDCIRGETFASIPVTDVSTKVEDQLILLITESKNELLMTPKHPVKTEQGIRIAENLNVTNRICMENGTYEEIYWLVIERQSTEVYSLVLEHSDCFIANGILTGDSQIEQKLSLSRKTPKELRFLEMQEEMKKFRELFFNKSKE